MPKVRFIQPDGTVAEFDGAVGESVMQVGTGHDVKGMVAQCGGFCNCATCHVYVDPAWAGKLKQIEDLESDMLEGTISERLPTSRLSCQIILTEDLDGLTVAMPDRQT